MKAFLDKIRKQIEDAKKKEERVNKHLGYPENHKKGTLTIELCWSDAEKLVEMAEEGYLLSCSIVQGRKERE